MWGDKRNGVGVTREWDVGWEWGGDKRVTREWDVG